MSHLDLLPEAEFCGEQMIAPGQTIFVSRSGERALVNALLIKGNPVVSMTIGIQGRGTLNIPLDEFDHLLSAMLALHKHLNAPMVIDPVSVNDASDLGLKL